MAGLNFSSVPSNNTTVRHYSKDFILIFGQKKNSTPGAQIEGVYKKRGRCRDELSHVTDH